MCHPVVKVRISSSTLWLLLLGMSGLQKETGQTGIAAGIAAAVRGTVQILKDFGLGHGRRIPTTKRRGRWSRCGSSIAGGSGCW